MLKGEEWQEKESNMAEYMHLIGTEQIQSAANRMVDVAERMNIAANTINETFRRHEQAMSDLMLRIDDLIDVMKEDEEEVE